MILTVTVMTKIKKTIYESTINIKVEQVMKKLQASYNNDANKIVKQATQEKGTIENLNFLINMAMVFNNIKPTLEEPQRLNKAWNHPNKESHRKWQGAICKVFADMN